MLEAKLSSGRALEAEQKVEGNKYCYVILVMLHQDMTKTKLTHVRVGDKICSDLYKTEMLVNVLSHKFWIG